MKKIFTLIAASLFTVAVFAADRKPVVTLKTSRNYEIVIDGQSYFNSNSMMNISNIRQGQHSIKVFEMSRNLMSRRGKKLVDASSFQVRNNDVSISVDFRGQISITENRFGYDRRNGSGNNGWDNSYGQDQRDNGQGNSYGHDQKNSPAQDSRDQNHSNDRNSRDKRF
jgi:hypothetical protein